MSNELFVPPDFVVPGGLTADQFRLEPLGPQHNASDYAAWSASMEHIHATPGFSDPGWPRPMSLADNLRDLERHAQDFAERRGFTYTVLATDTSDVIGCVYIYPPVRASLGEWPAQVESWVRADRAELDAVLYQTMCSWLEREWPFDTLEYAPRTSP